MNGGFCGNGRQQRRFRFWRNRARGFIMVRVKGMMMRGLTLSDFVFERIWMGLGHSGEKHGHKWRWTILI